MRYTQFQIFFYSFPCNTMPCSDCSALHGVNPNQKDIYETILATTPTK